ncbi:hypothetical protein P175DRAFT_0444000 [Aspergillus ochraceoroseus IBT 24754]|nr:uncharacterized protein P175DRAFT_0444000 [Aspergillus ochraceoroseus IBT 24754]PTU17965.1 hypothetical protein P175DRAFT_0444000 [Aspergillus ochraceoroseus IBT 24754]
MKGGYRHEISPLDSNAGYNYTCSADPHSHHPEKSCKKGDRHCINHNTTSITNTTIPTSTPCPGNTREDRSRWCDFSIDTDYYTDAPNTNVIREYWLEVDDVIVAPDGYPRRAMAINGSIPGPTIYADWGDTVVVHVTNNLHESKNGTSIHWHGLRQNYTNQNDGVVSITQCPIAPGSSTTYKWRATQYGTTWYHSHIGLQAWEGVAGAIVINGPATANYDEDKGTILLSDWTHQTVDELYLVAQTTGPPKLPNGLINGTNVYGSGCNATGSRFTMKVNEGTSYRLRLINGAINSHFKFMIDNHTLTVIAMDLVPIQPYTTDSISIAMGQRYDVIVTANQASTASSFWLRAIPQEACSANESVDNIKGIFYYGDEPTIPETNPWPFNNSCADEPMSSLIPHLDMIVHSPDWEAVTDLTVGRNKANLFRWYLNSTTMEVFWDNPTLLQIANNETVFQKSNAVISLPNENEWVYLIINTNHKDPHPIHLHGHDFFVLAQGANHWNGSLVTQNPPRRDTAVLPAYGYLVIAFETNNPGAWLMHCHIGWHLSEGLALQFVESYHKIEHLIDYDILKETCDAWTNYDEKYHVKEEDSGI